MRILPRTGVHTPTSARARLDLPAALGPMIPRALPFSSRNVTSCTTAVRPPGGAKLKPSTAKLRPGFGSAVWSTEIGMRFSVSVMRAQLCRNATNPRQLAMQRSTGASARAEMIDPAIMMPAVACWWITRYAPTPKIHDCSASLVTLDRAPSPPVTSVTRCWQSRNLWFTTSQSLPNRGAKPMACKTSALRRDASASALRFAPNVVASIVRVRVSASAISVSEISTDAPTSAVMPIQKCSRKQAPM